MSRANWIKAVLTVVVLAGVAGAIYYATTGTSNGAGGLPVAADPSDAALVALGRKLYAAQCASCHGKKLEGEPNWRRTKADGTLPAPPHDRTGHTWHHPDQILFAYTKFGGAKVTQGAVKSAMPGFEDKLTDREIAAILAFIKSRWPDEIRERQATMTEAYRNRKR